MKKTIAIFITIITAFTMVFAFSACDGVALGKESKIKAFEKSYSINEIKNIENNSFKKLNEVAYPSKEIEKFGVSDEFKAAVTNMAHTVYTLASAGKTDNFSYSPLGLYKNLSVVSLASDDQKALAEIDAVLGLDKDARKQNLINTFKTNYFSTENGTVQMYDGAFFTNEFTVNNGLIAALSEHYVEAFGVDFAEDGGINKMLDWVNGKVNEKNFIDKQFLQIDDDTAAFFFTTLFFDNKWRTTYNTESSAVDKFYGTSKTSDVTFMRHSYYGDCYDYGEYITCYDYYLTGLKIKYIVPVDKNADIFSLVDGVNFFVDDESRKITPPEDEEENYYAKGIIVNLKMPKFSTEYTFDFSATLKVLGIVEAFNDKGHAFNYAFSDMPQDYYTYIKFVKQKNKAAFSEDGTTIKSVTVTQMAKGTAAAPMRIKTINVDLDRPFIYVIYDANDLPLCVGNVNDL